jgi:hypothetical protein
MIGSLIVLKAEEKDASATTTNDDDRNRQAAAENAAQTATEGNTSGAALVRQPSFAIEIVAVCADAIRAGGRFDHEVSMDPGAGPG